jgi:cytochrome P450
MSASFNPAPPAAADYLKAPRRRDLDCIPGDNGLPLLGHLLSINRDVDGFLAQRVERYGQLSRMAIGPIRGVLVTHPDHLQQVLLDSQENFSSTMGYDGNVSHMYGGSIIAQDFAEHKATRRVFQTAFKREALAGYVDIMNPAIRENIADWGRESDFRYVTAVRRLLIDIGARVFFGLDAEPAKIREIDHYFREINQIGLMAVVHWNIPGTKYWRGLRGKRHMEALIHSLVLERREHPGRDLTSILANERNEEGDFWPAELLLPHLNILLFAAHDTTSGATSHLMMYLAKPENQALQESLRQQALDLGKENPSFEDLENYAGMEHAILEALRLHPAVASIMRRTTRDVRIGDRDIPAHTMLFNMAHWAHRSAQFWTDPGRFDPGRFSEQRREHKGHSFQYLPFGGGAHKCVGMHVAMMNAKLILHHTLRRYRFELQPGYDCRCQVLPLPFPSRELPLKVTPL